jgi:hypothetical protein
MHIAVLALCAQCTLPPSANPPAVHKYLIVSYLDHLQGRGFLSAGMRTSVDVADRLDLHSDTIVRNVGHSVTLHVPENLKTRG